MEVFIGFFMGVLVIHFIYTIINKRKEEQYINGNPFYIEVEEREISGMPFNYWTIKNRDTGETFERNGATLKVGVEFTHKGKKYRGSLDWIWVEKMNKAMDIQIS